MGFIHYAHTTLAQAFFQLIATIKDGFARNRLKGLMPIKRAVIDMVREAGATGCTFFHWLTRYEDGVSLSSSANGNRVMPMANPP
jgi:hypothetical protein